MFVLARALTYAAFFIGFVLVFLPARVLAWSGVIAPAAAGAAQYFGMAVAGLGAVLMLACILTFALRGRGTPAPFDPPRKLVVAGPYRIVRNPMYLGAGGVLAGAALVYASGALLVYAAVFLLIMHLFVIFYEEPVLRETFGGDYESYCRNTGRWWPRTRSRGNGATGRGDSSAGAG